MSEPFPSQQKNIEIETGPVRCGRCGRAFAHLAFEDLQGITQLRCGDVLIPKIEAHCLHCGWRFYHNIKEKDIEKMTMAYGKLLKEVKMYNAE